MNSSHFYHFYLSYLPLLRMYALDKHVIVSTRPTELPNPDERTRSEVLLLRGEYVQKHIFRALACGALSTCQIYSAGNIIQTYWPYV